MQTATTQQSLKVVRKNTNSYAENVSKSHVDGKSELISATDMDCHSVNHPSKFRTQMQSDLYECQLVEDLLKLTEMCG